MSHAYDHCGSVDPHVGVVLDDVMHGCYTILLVSWVGIEYGCSHKGTERLGRLWLNEFMMVLCVSL